MISERIRLLVEQRIAQFSPKVQRIYRIGANKLLDIVGDLEAQARLEAWKDGWAKAVEYGTGLYFGEADAKHFLEFRDKLIDELRKDPEIVLNLMPSLLEGLDGEQLADDERKSKEVKMNESGTD